MAKSLEEKRARRGRYKIVVDHFRTRYGCTAKEVFGIVTGFEREAFSLKEQVEKLNNDLQVANLQINEKDGKILELESKVGELEILANNLGTELSVYQTPTPEPELEETPVTPPEIEPNPEMCNLTVSDQPQEKP